MTKYWNRLGAWVKTAVAAAGVLLMLAGLLACLHLARVAWDEGLFARAYARPLGPTELDPQAARLPLVRALWDKYRYYDGTVYEYEAEENASLSPLGPGEETYYRQLYRAGVLPNPDGYRQQNYGEGVYVAAGDFTQVGSLLLYGELAVYADVTVQESQADFDLEEACLRYIDYLGLAELDDWQPARLLDVPDMDSAAFYSSKAQLLVQMIVDRRYVSGVGVRCTATALARDVFAQQNLAGA